MTHTAERTPVFPSRHVPVARTGGHSWLHALELAGPLALGQRALVVGPARSGKTTLLRELGRALIEQVPELELHVVLVDRPVEEFMEWRADLRGAQVHGSASDAGPEEHVAIDHVFERAQEVAAAGGDAAVLVDSLAALARALNVVAEEDARVLTGGMLATALREARQRFATGRAYEPDGSLTVVATASIETDAELDEVVFHELVGTGNMEIRLSGAAVQAGLFPPLDLSSSGARHTERILGDAEADRRAALRARVVQHGPTAGVALLLDELERMGSLGALLDVTD